MSDAIWVTGLGAATPLGWSARETWDGVVSGRSGIGPIKRFPTFQAGTSIAGTVPGTETELPDDSLALRFAASATGEALADAGLAVGDPELALVANHGERRLPRHARDAGTVVGCADMTAAVADQVGAPNHSTVYGACAGGLLAIGTAMKLLQAGHYQVAIAGGADCLVREFDFFQFCNLYAMSSREVAPEGACCPFDRRRDGFVLAEGAAFAVVETEAHARRRGAEPRAVLRGFGYSQNAYHMVASPPDGLGPSQAIAEALADASVPADRIDYINAHGTSTRDNDWCETLAIRKALGAHADAVPVSASKSELGHLMAAAGAAETVVTVLALENDTVPPTINLEEPDPRCDLDYVPWTAREAPLSTVMTNSFGFGGHNACLVIGKP